MNVRRRAGLARRTGLEDLITDLLDASAGLLRAPSTRTRG